MTSQLCHRLIFAALCLTFCGDDIRSAYAAEGVWRQRGFEDFRRGTFGNGGQNLYVSRAGVLQRIFQFDLNGDGFMDLVICNSHGKFERPPTYLYPEPLAAPTNRIELPADGAASGAVADLNGDGYDDLVIAMADDGARSDLNSYIYFGAREGFSEKRMLLLPAPGCLSTTTGDFNGDGKPDVAFALKNKLRIFHQNALGFEHKRFQELIVSNAVELAAHDFSADGATDLVVRKANGELEFFWGGPKGLSRENYQLVPVLRPFPEYPTEGLAAFTEARYEASPLAKVVVLEKIPCVFAAEMESVRLIPVHTNHSLGAPIQLNCPQALAVAAGDVNGDGLQDLVLACRQKDGTGERSWIYWGDKAGFAETNRTSLTTRRACDVALTDLDGDGCDEIVFCQYFAEDSYSSTSLVYRGSRQRKFGLPLELSTADARRVLVTHAPGQRAGQLVFINRMLGEKLGNPDASIFWGSRKGFDPDRRQNVASWGAMENLTGDFNDDGRPDLILVNCAEDAVSKNPPSYVFFSGPKGFAHEPTLKLPTTRATGVACADLDRDGFLDLIFSSFENPELLVLHGNPQGWDTNNPERIRLEYDGVIYKEATWVYLADLNADGWLDLVVPMILDDRSLILWGGPPGFSLKHCTVLSVERAASARAADLTGSGYLDLILGGHNVTVGTPHDSFAYIYWNGPDGLRQDRRTQLSSAGVNSMSVADFNRDGTLDLYVGSYHAGLERDTDSFIYWNRKGRGFSDRDRQRLFTHSASGSLAADFNEDGWIDLAQANHKVEGDHRGWSAVWWGRSTGFNAAQVTKLPSIGPHGITCMSPANQRDGGPEEFFESAAFELPANARPTAIAWEADVPRKTWLKAQVRTAETREQLAQASWQGPKGTGSWFTKPQSIPRGLTGQWMQYRLALGATNGVATPRVREVSVNYSK